MVPASCFLTTCSRSCEGEINGSGLKDQGRKKIKLVRRNALKIHGFGN